MSNKITREEFEEFQSLLIVMSLQLEAFVSVLEKKGLLTREDIDNEMDALQNILDSMEEDQD